MSSDSITFRTHWESHPTKAAVAFSAMCRSHRRATDAVPSETLTLHVVLAGAVVRMRIVGRELAGRIGRPFRHLFLVGSPTRHDLAVDLWDERVAGVPCPESAERPDEGEPTAGDHDPPVTIGSPSDRCVGHLRPEILVWTDREAARLIGCAPTADGLSIQDRGKPLHFPLLLWHADRGIPIAHAALVSREEQGILLVGKGGSGKTTAALACLVGGLDFLADDYVGLERTEDGLFVGHGLYDSSWLTADGEARFPKLVPHLLPSERTATTVKRLIQLSDVAADRLRRTARIGAVAITSLGAGPASSIRPVPKAEALLAVAPSSMLRLPISGPALLDRMTQLVDCVPTYRLEVGWDLAGVPPLVSELLGDGRRK